MKHYSVGYKKNDIIQTIIVNANNSDEAKKYIETLMDCEVYGATILVPELYADYKKRGMPEVTVPDIKAKSVFELTREELDELKQNYYIEKNPNVSMDDLLSINEIVSDKEIFAYYSDDTFTKDDFFCNQGTVEPEFEEDELDKDEY